MGLKKRAFKKRFYDYTISVFRISMEIINNEQIPKETAIYSKVDCAIWK
jgi:hypothetical protein